MVIEMLRRNMLIFRFDFESVGKKIWLDNELQLNSFTAISGSGPAYYFYLTECIQTIAIEEGFSKEASKIISRQLIVGAGKLSEFSDIDISQLRKMLPLKKEQLSLHLVF